MGKPFKIIISPEGTITSVYSDKMGLHELGRATIHRATEVKFNNTEGWWEILSLPPHFSKSLIIAKGFAVRSDAIAWEVDFLNENMEKIIEAKGSYIPECSKEPKSAGG